MIYNLYILEVNINGTYKSMQIHKLIIAFVFHIQQEETGFLVAEFKHLIIMR